MEFFQLCYGNNLHPYFHREVLLGCWGGLSRLNEPGYYPELYQVFPTLVLIKNRLDR